MSHFSTRRPRTLVLALDGTWEQFNSSVGHIYTRIYPAHASFKNTNVVRFFSMLQKDDGEEQVCYYQTGIGTIFPPGLLSRVFELAAKAIDAAVAWHLDLHVIDAYRFIMQNYRKGDKICIFGFSRGAYTARALAGMLYKVGLLPRYNEEQLLFAYRLYSQSDHKSVALAAEFKTYFCHNVQVEFVGVWETVSCVGLIASKTLPFTNSNRSIKTFRHALALDERRAHFQPNLFHRPLEDHPPKAPRKRRKRLLDWLNIMKPGRVRNPDYSIPDDDENWNETDILEVWFIGVHGDVGGGAVDNNVEHKLGNISLRWMIRQVLESQCGILFNNLPATTSILDHIQLDDDSPGKQIDAVDAVDALQPIHDDIHPCSVWWIPEMIPRVFRAQDAQGHWRQWFGLNLGRGRKIVVPNPNFHVSVKTRMDELGYVPNARWNHDELYVE